MLSKIILWLGMGLALTASNASPVQAQATRSFSMGFTDYSWIGSSFATMTGHGTVSSRTFPMPGSSDCGGTSGFWTEMVCLAGPSGPGRRIFRAQESRTNALITRFPWVFMS